MTAPASLSGTDGPLLAAHDVALLDLDGVVYVGTHPVPEAAAALAAAASQGLRLGYVTNNASRTPAEVVGVLAGVGVEADPTHVVTSAQAAARVLAERLDRGTKVLVVGTAALAEEVRARGLQPVEDLSTPVAAVVQGFSPDTDWRRLALATRAVRDGAWFVATNVDPTVPSQHGPLPGNGALVGVVAAVSGVSPTVTGKPEPAMHVECVRRLSARTPLVVGDRLDTDIEGAARVGCPSLLVFTGVTSPKELLATDRAHRPTHLAADLWGLHRRHPAVVPADGGWSCDGWWAGPDGTLSGPAAAPGSAPEPANVPDEPARWSALRVLCAAAWSARDAHRELPTWAAADDQASAALRALGIAPPAVGE